MLIYRKHADYQALLVSNYTIYAYLRQISVSDFIQEHTRICKQIVLSAYIPHANSTLKLQGGFPSGSVVKNLPANAGDTGLIPDPGRSHIPWSN